MKSATDEGNVAGSPFEVVDVSVEEDFAALRRLPPRVRHYMMYDMNFSHDATVVADAYWRGIPENKLIEVLREASFEDYVFTNGGQNPAAHLPGTPRRGTVRRP